jgi:hypothetical protein
MYVTDEPWDRLVKNLINLETCAVFLREGSSDEKASEPNKRRRSRRRMLKEMVAWVLVREDFPLSTTPDGQYARVIGIVLPAASETFPDNPQRIARENVRMVRAFQQHVEKIPTPKRKSSR